MVPDFRVTGPENSVVDPKDTPMTGSDACPAHGGTVGNHPQRADRRRSWERVRRHTPSLIGLVNVGESARSYGCYLCVRADSPDATRSPIRKPSLLSVNRSICG
ncbi:hypothetical protein GCM10010232_68200 [Streptomyces amakusaensis]